MARCFWISTGTDPRLKRPSNRPHTTSSLPEARSSGSYPFRNDSLKEKACHPRHISAARPCRAAFAPGMVLIEDKASGTQLIQELVELGLHAVTRYQPQSDKIMRMHAQTAMIENGFVHL